MKKTIEAGPWFTCKTKPHRNEDQAERRTDYVLIDLKGNREEQDYHIGYYSYDRRHWMYISGAYLGEKPRLMRWQYLPLAKYDDI